MSDFISDLKNQTNNLKPEQILSLDELALLEDELINIEEFRNSEKDLPDEQLKKNKDLQEKGFLKRAEQILGIKINMDFYTLSSLIKKASILIEKYGYDDMDNSQKNDFNEASLKSLYEINSEDEDIFVEEVDKIDEKIM